MRALVRASESGAVRNELLYLQRSFARLAFEACAELHAELHGGPCVMSQFRGSAATPFLCSSPRTTKRATHLLQARKMSLLSFRSSSRVLRAFNIQLCADALEKAAFDRDIKSARVQHAQRPLSLDVGGAKQVCVRRGCCCLL